MATWKRCIRKLFVEDICCAEKVKVEACCADLHFKRMSIFVALLLILIDGMLFGHVYKYLKYTKESTVMIIESNWATCHWVRIGGFSQTSFPHKVHPLLKVFLLAVATL